MSVVSELEIRLFAGIARLQQDMDRAQQTVTGTMARISASVGNAMNLIKGFAAALAVGAFVNFIKGGIDAADAMDELREKTGLLMEDVAGVRLIFQREGFGDQELVASMSKLSKAITEGGGALGAMKISTKEASGEFRSTKAVLYDVADQFAAMENGAQKSAFAMDIFGKSGVALIPMLNGGSEGMRDMAEMAEKLGLVLSQETATAAGDFNDTMFLIGQGSQGIAQGIAAELVPTLNSLAGSFLESMTSGGKLASTAHILATGLKILYTLGVGIVEVFSTVGKSLGGAAAQIVAVLNGDFKQAGKIGELVGKDLAEGWQSSAKMISDAWDGTGEAAVAAAAKTLGAQKDLLAAQKEREAAEKKAAAEHAAAVKAAQDYVAGLKVEVSQVGLSADQVKMMAAARAAAKAPTAELRMEIMRAALALDIETKAFAASEASIKSVTDAAKLLEDTRASEYASLANEVQAGKDAIATYGLSKGAIEALTLARLEDRLARRGPQDLDLDEAEVNHLMRLIALQKEKAQGAVAFDQLEKQKKVNEEMVADYQKTVDKYDDVFRTGFADMLNNGKSGWKSFTTSLLTTFKTTVADQIYKMLAQPFVVSIVGNILGVTGANAATTAGSSAAGGAASSMAGTAVGGLFGAGGLSGSLMAGAGWLTGATSLSGALTAGTSLIGTGTLAGLASGMGVLAGALGPVALGIAAVTSLAKKWDTSGTIHTGGAASASAAGVSNIDAKTLGFQRIDIADATNKLTAQLATSIVGILDSTAQTFGKTAGYTVSTGFADDSSRDGAWGALSIHNANGLVSAWGDANSRWAPKVFSDGEAGQKEYLADISKSVRAALDGIGMPDWAKSMLSSLGSAPALEDLAKVVDTINATQKALALMGDRLTGFAGLSDAAVSALIKASGGMEGLAANASSYYDAFYSEGEKAAVVTKQVAEALKAVGVEMPATREGYRAEVEARLKLGAAGTDAVAALLANASAYAQVVPAIEAATAVTDALTSTNADYQQQIDQLLAARQGEAAVRALETSGMAASTVALYDRLAALKAEDAAATAAAAAAQTLANTNAGYQQQIDQLLAAREGEAAVRALEIAGMSASTVALYDRLKALQAEDKATAAATEAIKKAQDAAAETARQAQQQYAEQVRDWQTKVDSARNALSQAYERESSALESAISKAREFAQAMRSFSDSLKLGDLSTLSPEAKYAEAQRQFANATPEQLQGASTALLQASKAYNSNSEAYARDYAAVEEAIGQAAVAADSQVVAAQQQLSYLAQQVSGIAEVNKSVLSVAEALAAYKAAVAAPIVPAQNYGAGTVAPGYLPGTTAGWTNIDWNYIRKQAVDGSHENGLWSVPRNGYIAELHEDEAVLTRQQARQWRAGQGVSASGSSAVESLLREVVAENREMRAELAEVKGQLQAANTQRGAIAQAQLRQGDAVAQKLDKTARKLETIQ
ncbi:hypothetical protein GTP38_23340 [Duganella sp. FT94W]|uniref:Bacteriophage tail tape measure N-terminal domain-containing protein n=1 Tax=Duganella lactea TaxID=2692173 RepID=A0ABW9VCR0_9BURK|nr:hypothetical protein [Duganella lactea]MYM37265.1 hypothetical protein [Duganella lactea]